MRALVSGVCLVLMLVGAQESSGIYAGAITKYVAGDSAAAFEALARVPHAVIQKEIDTSLMASRSEGGRMAARRRLEAIAMLHTEYTLSGDPDPRDVAFHIGMARRALTIWTWTLTGKMLGVKADEVQRARDVLPRWTALAASVLLVFRDDQNARTIVDEGLKLFPDDETLWYWRARVMESQAVWIGASAFAPPTLASRGTSVPGEEAHAERATWEAVEEAYRQTLQRGLADYEAHLHLGYALYSLQRDGPAKTEYELARDRSSDPFVVYVADLLLARLEEDQNDPAAAVRDYEHALAKMPGAQSAYIGLGLLEARRGNQQRARDVTLRLASIPEKERVRDPWWPFRTSRVAADDLEWLRAAVRP
jgi:hypothetical protein